MNAICGVLLADVVRSRAHADFASLRDTTLASLTQRHREEGYIEGAYAVTAWDEFQAVLLSPSCIPQLLWEIRSSFYPLRIRAGLGMGHVEHHGDGPANVSRSGEAFVRARKALEQVKGSRRADQRSLTSCNTGQINLDLALNAFLPLIDLLTERITPSQWETIKAYERLGRQDRVATSLKRDRSTVSRALKRSGYWTINRSLNALETLLDRHFSGTLPHG